MSRDGTVGPIGGIADKIVAAQRVGADVFLVPAENMEAARSADAGDMRLVSVGSFDDALTALGVAVPDEADEADAA
jgi:PDZ domain-containing protein